MGGYIGATAVGLTTTAADVQGDITSTDTTPELILKNTSEEDTEGGREGKITFKGEQSGGEESTLAQIQSSHDGTADDQKGDLIFKTNDGSDGSSPTEVMRLDSSGDLLLGTTTSPSSADVKQVISASSGAFTQFSVNGGAGSVIGSPAVSQMALYTTTGNVGSETYTERMRIDSSGKVGIGTTSPTGSLHISNSAPSFYMTDTTNNTEAVVSMDNAGSLILNADLNNEASSSNIRFAVDGTEAMRINDNNQLLIGRTTDASAAGLTLDGDGFCRFVRSGSSSGIFDRRDSDGNIALFRKDGSNVGSITTKGGDVVIHSTASGHCGFRFTGTPSALPTNNSGDTTDNQMDIGNSSTRMDDIFATNGTIQTSDRNEKQDIEDLSEAELRVATAAKGLIKKFRWKDAVEKKGDDARIHVGIIAQDLQAAFEAEGLDAGRYAMFISDTWWEADRVVPAVEANEEEGIEAVAEHTVTDIFDTQEEAPEGATERTRLGVRYPELLAFIIGAM